MRDDLRTFHLPIWKVGDSIAVLKSNGTCATTLMKLAGSQLLKRLSTNGSNLSSLSTTPQPKTVLVRHL